MAVAPQPLCSPAGPQGVRGSPLFRWDAGTGSSPCHSWPFLWARLHTHPWRAGSKGAVPLGMAFTGGCLKCQVRLDALTTGTTH